MRVLAEDDVEERAVASMMRLDTQRAFVGLFVPPPSLEAFSGRHPHLVSALQRVEDRVGGWPGIRA